MSSHSSHHPQEVLLAQFSLYVHKGGLSPIHFISSNEFKQFVKSYGINHITSSQHYPQSNGFTERMVSVIKQTMTKCSLAKKDPQMAFLILCTTPLSHNLPSPAELLYARPIRSILLSVVTVIC